MLTPPPPGNPGHTFSICLLGLSQQHTTDSIVRSDSQQLDKSQHPSGSVKLVPLCHKSQFSYPWQKGQTAILVPISMPKRMLTSRLPRWPLGSLSITSTCHTFQSPCGHLGSSHPAPTLNFRAWTSLPSASLYPYSPASSALRSLLCSSLFLVSFSSALASPNPKPHGQVQTDGHVQSTAFSLGSGLSHMPLPVLSFILMIKTSLLTLPSSGHAIVSSLYAMI